ncbi:MAG TPA: serine/threonine-protein kinase [Phycisphaerales bacterium]|nr:serine/threonine-protein kinase [Phycisphaerales bacterium]
MTENSGGAQPAMNAAERLKRAEKIYFEVAALLPHEREGAVARACGADAALAADVHSLLRAGDQVGGFLERPALGGQIGKLAEVAGFTDDMLGQTLGSYRVERRIASGGMGTVYLAVRSDGQFSQQVAIKVVKRGMDSEEVLRRFAAERQTLAALDHPNVARLFDAGVTRDGRPYLVMEYVDGAPIDEYCDAKRLSVKERLRLFRTVCDAVHAAHQALIIHRDLKPTNILVTKDGVPKLLDFGIAKLLTDGPGAGQTLESDRRLTPEYASPEQVRGELVTTGSDVYSLGVVLYELLTGLRPYRFATRTTDEVRRIVCVEVPPIPSQAVTVRVARVGTGTKGGVLGTVSGTAEASLDVGTPRADTPRTRGVSSTRLRGLLRGDVDTIVMTALRKEPARRYASAEQFSSDIGRYLAGMPITARKDTFGYRVTKFVRRHAAGTALSMLAVLLLAGATVVLYTQRQELRERQVELTVANTRLMETRDFLVSMISQGETGKLGPNAPLSEVMNSALTRLRESPPADPMTRASFQQAVGRCAMSLGMLKEAREQLDGAAAVFRAELAGESDAVTAVRIDLAVLRSMEGDAAGAEADFRGLLGEERSRVAGVRTMREIDLLNNLGAVLRQLGRGDESLAVQREALEARETLHGAGSLQAAESHNNIASALFVKGDFDGAIGEFRTAIAIREKLLRPDHPLIVRAKSNLGLALVRAGRPAEGAVPLREAYESWNGAFGHLHAGRVAAGTSLAEAHRRLNEFDESVALLEEVLNWQREHTPGEANAMAATEANIGVTLAAAGRDAEAAVLLERTLPVVEQAKMAGITRAAKEALAGVYERAGRIEDAARLRVK